MKFKKKPIVIEAEWLIEETSQSIADWCGGRRISDGQECAFIIIPTLEGDMRAEIGDYIIKGVQGEFYPCKPDIFAETYEPVYSPRRKP